MQPKRTWFPIALTLIALVFQLLVVTPTTTVAAASRCNAVTFVADLTVPDGTTFAPGVAFVKTWRLKNTGTCTWTKGYGLAFVSGDPLGATSSVAMPANVAPNQVVDISLDMNAPTTPGQYRGYWMLKNTAGVKFGLGSKADKPFWVDIKVSKPVTVTPPGSTGLNIQGTVKLNGVGLAGVRIYRSFASYSGTLVATTGANGQYTADFVYIPGDEMVTVWAEMNGYTFAPGNYFWRHYHGLENRVLDFTATATSAPPPPTGGTVFDFTAEICAAKWRSGASLSPLPCPLADGDARGFILRENAPKLENGLLDSAPGLIMFPQNKYNGYLQGFYPEYTVQPGDHFRASVGCAYGAACYVTFRLDYYLNGTLKILWTWKEKNEGQIYQLDKDLSALAGKKVSFVLTVLASGPATGDRVIWGQPRIVRAGYVSPTPSLTPSPTITPTPPIGDWLKYTNAQYGFELRYPPRLEDSPSQDNNYARIDLPIRRDTNLHEKYLEIIVTENANPCQSPLASQSMLETSGIVTINGIPFLKQTGGDAGMSHRHQWIAYSTFKDNVCVSLDFVLHSVSPGVYSTPPAVFDYAAETAVFEQMVSTFAWLIPTSTPTPTLTPTPAGNVTNITTSVNLPPLVNCAGSTVVNLFGDITTNGPANVTYHWEISGAATNILPEQTVTFTTASTLRVSLENYAVNCGSYTARLVVTSPNATTAQTDFTLAAPTVLPIYDFDTFAVLGTLACSEVGNYTWVAETCNGESGGCQVSQTALFGKTHAGFFRHDGNVICGLNLP